MVFIDNAGNVVEKKPWSLTDALWALPNFAYIFFSACCHTRAPGGVSGAQGGVVRRGQRADAAARASLFAPTPPAATRADGGGDILSARPAANIKGVGDLQKGALSAGGGC